MLMAPDDLLALYRQGVFPMADHRDDDGFLIVEPHKRALLPIIDLHIPHSLKKFMRKHDVDIRLNTAFADVIRHCAEARPTTWINNDIEAIFIALHTMGHAHSVECWMDNQLAGGLYGLAVGRVFCGESMFSNTTNASKVALVYLTALLEQAHFSLLDAQFSNPHLEQFGLYEMPQDDYVAALTQTLEQPTNFPQCIDDTTHAIIRRKLNI